MSSHTAFGFLPKSDQLQAFPLPTPTVGPSEVLVKTLAIGHTSGSQWQVDFKLFSDGETVVLGGNIVGDIIARGVDVREELQVGDRIMSFNFANIEGKACQEITLLAENLVTKIPTSLSIGEAASIPENFITAYHAFQTELNIDLPLTLPPASPPADAEKRILIWGGATCSGIYAIQILAVSGFKHIITTASHRHHELLRSYGATEIYDYTSPTVLSDIGQVDIALDCVSDEDLTVRPISKLVKKGGKAGLLLPVRKGGYGSITRIALETDVSFAEGVEVVGVRMHFYQKNSILKEKLQPILIRDWLSSGAIKPAPHRIVQGDSPLESVKNVLEEWRKGTVRGEKLVTLL